MIPLFRPSVNHWCNKWICPMRMEWRVYILHLYVAMTVSFLCYWINVVLRRIAGPESLSRHHCISLANTTMLRSVFYVWTQMLFVPFCIAVRSNISADKMGYFYYLTFADIIEQIGHTRNGVIQCLILQVPECIAHYLSNDI